MLTLYVAMGLLRELKKKPSEVKDLVAILGALFVTLGIGVFWVLSLPAQLAHVGDSLEKLNEGTKAQIATVNETLSEASERVRSSVPTTTTTETGSVIEYKKRTLLPSEQGEEGVSGSRIEFKGGVNITNSPARVEEPRETPF